MEKYYTILSGLKRKETPLYILFDGIYPSAWLQVQKQLMSKKHGEEVDVIICSGGGSPNDAYRMIRAFREKYTTVNVIVPFWAKSAATLFSFGATKLVLHECGELGPIDAQIKKDDERSADGEWSSALNVVSSISEIEKRSKETVLEMFNSLRTKDNPEVVKIGRRQLAEMLLQYSANFYAPLLQKIEPMEMGQMARALDIGRMYARRILKQYTETSDEKIEELLDFLVYECPDHGYVVDYNMIHSIVPFVIRADEEPFGSDYYENLSELSLQIMTVMSSGEMPRMNGFLESFAPKKETDTINKQDNTNAKHTLQNQKPKDTEDRGSGSRPTKDEDKKNDTDRTGTPNSAGGK